MITSEELGYLEQSGESSSARENILRARSSFTKEDGIDFLSDFFISAGMFGKLNPESAADVGAYNHAIEVADRLGLFTESSVKRMLSILMEYDPIRNEILRSMR